MPDSKDKDIIDLEAEKRFSYNGLNVLSGEVMEECNADLRWPDCIETYKQMQKDATIAPTLNVLDINISKVEWSVQIPEGYENELSDKREFLEEFMYDMEHPWSTLIRNAAGISRFGFAPLEKVYRKRLFSEGSKHNDGLWSIRAFPLIAQDSVSKWVWSDDGRDLIGLKQKINKPSEDESFETSYNSEDNLVFIPRNKFILFRANANKDSPIGESPLNAVYMAWRFKAELERHEATSVANDVRGLKVITVPPNYLSKSASKEEKETAEYFKDILRGLHNGEQSGVLLPAAYNESGKPLFEFKVVSVN